MDDGIVIHEGALDARGLRIGIVASRFNDFVIDRLLQAAVDTLIRHGAAAGDIEVVRVPGAFELPLVVKRMAASGRHDALIALGCVIRGETPHFDYVAGEASRGVARASYEYDLPVSFGVLTVDTVQQAEARAGTGSGNKGVEAALAAVQMARVLRRIERRASSD